MSARHEDCLGESLCGQSCSEESGGLRVARRVGPSCPLRRRSLGFSLQSASIWIGHYLEWVGIPSRKAAWATGGNVGGCRVFPPFPPWSPFFACRWGSAMPWECLDPNLATFALRHRDYLDKINLYRQRVWSCKYTGKESLTFEEALASEEAYRRLADAFPEVYRATGEQRAARGIVLISPGRELLPAAFPLQWHD